MIPKNVLSIVGIATLTMTLSSTAPAFAQTSLYSPSESLSTANNVSKVKDEGTIVKMYRTTENGLQELSPTEMKKMLQDKTKNRDRGSNAQPDAVERPSLISYGYKFNEDGVTTAVALWGQVKRVSSILQNASSSPATRTISYSTTDTYSCNLSLNAGMKNALTATLGGSWSSTNSYSDSNTVTIQPNQYEWAEWTPIKDNPWGYMQTTVYDGVGGASTYSDWCSVYTARYVSGHDDGILILKTDAYPPSY